MRPFSFALGLFRRARRCRCLYECIVNVCIKCNAFFADVRRDSKGKFPLPRRWLHPAERHVNRSNQKVRSSDTVLQAPGTRATEGLMLVTPGPKGKSPAARSTRGRRLHRVVRLCVHRHLDRSVDAQRRHAGVACGRPRAAHKNVGARKDCPGGRDLFRHFQPHLRSLERHLHLPLGPAAALHGRRHEA